MYAASSVIGSQGQLLSGAGDQLSGAGNYAGGLGQYLQGEADIVRAQAEFMKAQMDAFKTQQEVHKQKLENRRLQFDQTRYEEANTPTFEERREQSQMEARRRAMTNPPLTEIWTAKSLNDLLPEVQNQRRLGVRPPLALGEEALEHINVTKGKGGNLGLLKSEGELSWPQALRQPAYAPMRNQLDRLTQSAVKSARATGQVDAGTLHDLSAGVQSLSDGLKRTSKDVSPPKYIEAKRFLNDLSDAVTALGQDDVAENFFHNEAIQGQTVAELIDYMTVHGLRFAPAVSGDEQAYVALHRALVACVGSSTLTAKQ